jgi:hypothetical protein
MKKSLVLAMTMAIGVSATAFAANPFSDLPAGHWAYASVAKLAAAGVVDGYPDGTFKGERTMTRYEMAQIVAKALAKGTIDTNDKLVSEFADELDKLGVRVAKLEKNADNVKITGNIRYHYHSLSGDWKRSDSKIRSRLFLTGDINDNWNYVSMIQNEQVLAQSGLDGNESGDSGTNFSRAYLDGRLGNAKVTAGRYQLFLVNGYVNDTRCDGIKVQAPLGKNFSLTANYGKLANSDQNTFTASAGSSNADKFYTATLSGKSGNFTAEANYMKFENVQANGMNFTDDKIWTIGAEYQAGKLRMGATYFKGDNETIANKGYAQNGYVLALDYAGAKSSTPGSWGLMAKYLDQAGSTYIGHTIPGDAWILNSSTYNPNYLGEGFKGLWVGGGYTVAKNMVANVYYFDLKGQRIRL